jgi:hypothetical protein
MISEHEEIDTALAHAEATLFENGIKTCEAHPFLNPYPYPPLL